VDVRRRRKRCGWEYGRASRARGTLRRQTGRGTAAEEAGSCC
jgi:hypothetical protein